MGFKSVEFAIACISFTTNFNHVYNNMKNLLLFGLLLLCSFTNPLKAQFLEGVMSDGVLMEKGKIAAAASYDVDNEGIFLRGRYSTAFGEVFGGLGLYDDVVGTHIYLGLERTHKSYEIGEGINLNGFYQAGVAFRQSEIPGIDLTSTTFRLGYFLRYAVNEKISTYSGVNGAFVLQSLDTNILGTSVSTSSNDLQFTIPVGARYKLDEAGKMNIFAELGLGVSAGAGYLQAGFRYGL